MEVIKTRLATATHGTYTGLIHAFSRIYQREGILSFYRGLVPNMVWDDYLPVRVMESVVWQVGIFPYAGVEIACFEILFEQLNLHYNNAPPASLIVAAGTCSATFAQFISYPCSLIKTRLQVTSRFSLEAYISHVSAVSGSGSGWCPSTV